MNKFLIKHFAKKFLDCNYCIYKLNCTNKSYSDNCGYFPDKIKIIKKIEDQNNNDNFILNNLPTEIKLKIVNSIFFFLFTIILFSLTTTNIINQ